MDSGAFTEISSNGAYVHTPKEYAALIKRFSHVGKLQAAVAQDWMCEAHILKRTGLTVEEHQSRTIKNYMHLVFCMQAIRCKVYIIPVIQGYTPEEYIACIKMYGDLLARDAWVGVGSVCKRNTSLPEVAAVLAAIKSARPDLKLHAFGLKKTALEDDYIRRDIHTADSMSWNYQARMTGESKTVGLLTEFLHRQVRDIDILIKRGAPARGFYS